MHEGRGPQKGFELILNVLNDGFGVDTYCGHSLSCGSKWRVNSGDPG